MSRTFWLENRRPASAGPVSGRGWLRLEPLEDRTAPATLMVLNTNDSGADSLRQAILSANTLAGLDTIAFNISGGGHTITPISPLPTITEPVFIDGYTQPGSAPNTNGPGLGSNAVLLIELDGSAAGLNQIGLTITGGGSTVQGLVVNRFNAEQIVLSGLGGNVIAGNFIGTDATGTANFISSAGGTAGVYVNDAPNNVIGGTTPAARNVISLNRANGNVLIGGGNASGNRVEGNLIGTNAAGTAVLLRASPHGVRIADAPGNVIGGSVSAAGNVIAVAAGPGVWLRGAGTTGNRVEGNFIGTNAAGTAALPDRPPP